MVAKRLKIILATLIFHFCFLISNSAIATEQSIDTITYLGEEFSLYNTPLDSFFSENPNLLPQSNTFSTSNWNGYYADYEIKFNQLFVKEIYIETYLSETEDLAINKNPNNKENNGFSKMKFPIIELTPVTNNIFPNKSNRLMHWYSGLIIILPKDESIFSVQNFQVFQIINGNISQSAFFNYQEFRTYLDKLSKKYQLHDGFDILLSDYKKQNPEIDPINILSFFLADSHYTEKVFLDFSHPIYINPKSTDF